MIKQKKSNNYQRNPLSCYPSISKQFIFHTINCISTIDHAIRSESIIAIQTCVTSTNIHTHQSNDNKQTLRTAALEKCIAQFHISTHAFLCNGFCIHFLVRSHLIESARPIAESLGLRSTALCPFKGHPVILALGPPSSLGLGVGYSDYGFLCRKRRKNSPHREKKSCEKATARRTASEGHPITLLVRRKIGSV